MLLGGRDLLVLLLLEDVVSISCWLFLSGKLHIFVHIRYILVHIDYFIIVLRSSRIIIVHVVDHLHLVVHVRHSASLARIWGPCLKPAILELDLLDSACG